MSASFDIHISDVRAFLSCRRRWDYSSLLRQNYEPEEIPIHFLVGRAVHVAMYALYEFGLNPVDAYNDFIEHYIKIRETSLAFPDEKSKRQQQVRMGRLMVDNYLKWIRSDDAPDEGWETLANEMPFNLSMYNHEGKLSPRIQLAGRFDRVARWVGDSTPKRPRGSYWLWEYKTTARQPEEEWLELDNQVTTYAHAAGRILGVPIAGVHFRFMMKKAPEKPYRVRNGTQLSRAINSGAQGVSTTYDLYVEALAELAIDQLRAENVELTDLSITKRLMHLKQEYVDVLDQLLTRGWGEYFITMDVSKTPEQLQIATANLWDIGLEMARPSVKIYPSPEWMKCNFCSFRDPCKLRQAGKNDTSYLEHVYRKRDPKAEYDLDSILTTED